MHVCMSFIITFQTFGMTNYRIDRIGMHRHASTCIGADFDHIDTAKQGQGYKSTVSGSSSSQGAGQSLNARRTNITKSFKKN